MHPSTTTHLPSGPHRTHGIMSRLVRLAASVVFITLAVGSRGGLTAATDGAPFVCVHDAVALEVNVGLPLMRQGPLRSVVGLPYVAIMEDGEDEATAHEDVAAAAVNEVAALADSIAPTVTRTAAWGDFRIAVSAEDLTTPAYYCATVGQNVNNHRDVTMTCTADDILTDAKRDTLLNYLIPQAIQMHTDRLQVKRVKSTWQVTGMDAPVCRNFLIPSSHRTYGVSRTDMMLYVASVPSSANVGAWATTCQVFSNDQPAVAVLNVPAAYIGSNNDAQLIHAIAHQLGHALGFSDTFFSATPIAIATTATGVRGKTAAVPVLASTNVVAQTRAHYGCATATYMELEDQGNVGAGSSHWKMRNAQDELMSIIGGVGYYTALTIAAFEDLGFYKGVYANAENMTSGLNAGCTLFSDACVVSGVSQLPSMFCDAQEDVFRCTAGRLGLGSCRVDNYATALPTYFQYFATATEGGLYNYMDYCPSVVETSVGSCTQNATAASVTVSVFNVFSMASRCVDGSFTPKVMAGSTATGYYGMCVGVRCNSQTLSYSIQVNGAGRFRACTPGANITLSDITSEFEAGGYITCPPYYEVCQSNVQASADYQASVDAASSPRTAVMALAAFVLVVMWA